MKKIEDQFTVYLERKDSKGKTPWYASSSSSSSVSASVTAGKGADAIRLRREDPMSMFPKEEPLLEAKSVKMKNEDPKILRTEPHLDRLRREKKERERGERLRALQITNPKEYQREMAKQRAASRSNAPYRGYRGEDRGY